MLRSIVGLMFALLLSLSTASPESYTPIYVNTKTILHPTHMPEAASAYPSDEVWPSGLLPYGTSAPTNVGHQSCKAKARIGHPDDIIYTVLIGSQMSVIDSLSTVSWECINFATCYAQATDTNGTKTDGSGKSPDRIGLDCRPQVSKQFASFVKFHVPKGHGAIINRCLAWSFPEVKGFNCPDY